MFSPWSGLAAYISYLSQKKFYIILSLEVQHGAMEIMCNEKWCSYTLRAGSVLQNDEMFSEPDLPVLSMGINDSQHLARGSCNSLQNLLPSFMSFKAFTPQKGLSALLIDLVSYKSIKYSTVGPLAKIQIILEAVTLVSVS